MVITVWVQLLRGGENIGRADQIKLEDGSNVADLCDAVKVKFSNQLQTYDAALLNVSTARESSEYLRPAQKLQVLPPTKDDEPLFVHAPALAGGSEQASLLDLEKLKELRLTEEAKVRQEEERTKQLFAKEADETFAISDSSSMYEWLGSNVWTPCHSSTQASRWEVMLKCDVASNDQVVQDLLPSLTKITSCGTWGEAAVQTWSRVNLCSRPWNTRNLLDTHSTIHAAAVGQHCKPDLVLADEKAGLTEAGVVCLFELKESSSLPPAAIGQGLFAAQSALRKTRLRHRIFVLVTNLRQSRLLECELGHDDHKQLVKISRYANIEESADTLRCWVNLMLAADDVLDVPTKSVCGFSVVRMLGSGKTATVYEVDDATERKFAKLFSEQSEREREWEILQQLTPLHILPFRGLQSVDGMSGRGQPQYAIVGSPVLQAVTESTLHREHWIQLLDNLRLLHENGYVHRDVRPANIMLDNNTLKLIDFGYASKAGRECLFAGTITFASRAVLEKLASGAVAFTPQPSDDLESLVKYRCKSWSSAEWKWSFKSMKSLDWQQHARLAMEGWSSFTQRAPEKLSYAMEDMLNMARRCDYQGLRSAF